MTTLGSSSRCRDVRKVAESTDGNLIEVLGRTTSVVTGANTGIGKSTAQHLAYLGGTVVLACRNLDKANAAIEEIKSSKEIEQYEMKAEDLKLVAMELDLGSLQSVQTFVENLSEKILSHELPPLKLMVQNAGVAPQSSYKSSEGLDLTFQINHFGHFFLTKMLLRKDVNQLIEEQQLRIVVLSSDAHKKLSLATDKIEEENQMLHHVVGIPQEGFPTKTFGDSTAYASTKLCNVQFAQSLNEMDPESEFCNGAKITAVSVHPGLVKTTIIREKGLLQFLWNNLAGFFAKDIDQGASTSFFCSLMPDEDVAGFYFADCKKHEESKLAQGEKGKSGRDTLWKISEDLSEMFLQGKSFQTEPEN